MKTNFTYLIPICLVIFLTLLRCREPYNPPISNSNLNYLVVDGIIINGQDSTIVNLSRTDNISDSNFVPHPEFGARVTIIGAQGETYPLIEQTGGRYVTPQLNLNYNETYWLKIITSNGKQYISDSIPVKQTPAIDSLGWTKNGSTIQFYVNTHDAANNTRYYRWQYVETWQYNSIYNSDLIYENGALSVRTPSQNVYTCWNSNNSTDILVGTSTGLSQDVIFQQPLLLDSLSVYTYPVNIQLVLPELSQKFSSEYSLLVNQYAITPDAYVYWNNLKLNTEELGTLFSPEPSSQVQGNIHCITNPNEPVIGYIGASTLQQKRIFIKYNDLFLGSPTTPQIGCYEFGVPPDSFNFYFSKPILFTPVTYEFLNNGQLEGIYGAPTYCANCEFDGGVNVKPDYWPN
jgi:hypothetical protein